MRNPHFSSRGIFSAPRLLRCDIPQENISQEHIFQKSDFLKNMFLIYKGKSSQCKKTWDFWKICSWFTKEIPQNVRKQGFLEKYIPDLQRKFLTMWEDLIFDKCHILTRQILTRQILTRQVRVGFWRVMEMPWRVADASWKTHDASWKTHDALFSDASDSDASDSDASATCQERVGPGHASATRQGRVSNALECVRRVYSYSCIAMAVQQ